MLIKKEIVEAMAKGLNNEELAEELGTSLSTLKRYKAKYGLTNKAQTIFSFKDQVVQKLQNGLLKVKDFAKEVKLDLNSVYKIIHELEESGYAIEKSLNGYYINSNPKSQDLVFQHHAKRIKFGVVSDTHLGSREQQLTLLNKMYDVFKDEGCKLVFHAGDLVDGESVFRGQRYDVFIIGADNQKQYAIDNYPMRKGITTYMISGNHDLDYQKSTGVDIVKAVTEKRPDIVYCGQLGAYVELGKNTKAYIYHPGGSGSYAISYKPQKWITAVAPHKKPNLVFMGHYHQAEYIIVRNVHCIQTGCFQGQTGFLTRLGLEPQIGGWIVDLTIDDNGSINRIRPERIQFFNPLKKDY